MSKGISGALVALLACNGVAAAQTAAPQPAAPQPAAPQSADTPACPLPDMVLSADLKEVVGSDLMTVPVEINGKQKQFLLAVSANSTSISQAAVSDLGLTGPQSTETLQTAAATQSEASMFRNMDTGSTMQINMVDARNAQGSRDDRPRVTIKAFTIGGATGRNLHFAVARDNEIEKSAPYDGIITGDFFKQYDVEMDFAGKKITYLTPNKCSDPHKIVFWSHREVAVVPLSDQGGKLEVPVTIDGHQVNAVLDTASPNSVMRRDVAEDKMGLKTGTDMTPDGDRRDGDGLQIYRHTFPQITFAGGVTALNVPMAIQTNGMTHNLHKDAILGSRAQFKADPRIPAVTLGMDVLRQLHLYVVYGQQSIYMTAAQ